MLTTDSMMQKLLLDASILGLKGFIVQGWIPPESAGDDPKGNFILEKYECTEASEIDLRD